MFQVELFGEEYEANHPQHYNSLSITRPSLNWETFDKENAPQPFVVNIEIQKEIICLNLETPQLDVLTPQPFQPIRDKSPPQSLSSI